ncbi:MAG: hypothetical protein IIZ78_17550 [Clostridiales bacterium]|nr:hypothetical protein [Clostridiales bacterium]
MERDNIRITFVEFTKKSEITFFVERITDPDWCTLNEYKRCIKYIHNNSDYSDDDMQLVFKHLYRLEESFRFRYRKRWESVNKRIDYLKGLGYDYDKGRAQ